MALTINKRFWDEHFKKVSIKAGRRYSPKLNVELPIAELFEILCRTPTYYKKIRTYTGNVDRSLRRLKGNRKNKKVENHLKKFLATTAQLTKLLSEIKEYETKTYSWKKINTLTKRATDVGYDTVDLLRQEEAANKKEQEFDEKYDSERHYIYEIQRELRKLEFSTLGNNAKLSNHPHLLITGSSGRGKTHLLCDVMQSRLANKSEQFTVFAFGEFFNNTKDPWEQIIKQLGLNTTTKIFLEKMNALGRESSTRTLIIIDALNETSPPKYWKQNLKKVLTEIKKYPHIAIVLSVRTGFEEEIISKTVGKQLVWENHEGFKFKEWEAVTKFFEEYSIPLPEIPLLLPEFREPLFLLLFCESFDKREKSNREKGRTKQIFRGQEGSGFIFERFVKNASRKILKERGLPRNFSIWNTIIKNIAEAMIEKHVDRLTKKQLMEIINRHTLIVDGEQFIQALEKNLLLVKTPDYSNNSETPRTFNYKFPFQKFSDHLLGRYVFKKFETSNKTPRQFFAKNTKVGELLNSVQGYGLIEALAIQCPERLSGKELFEVAPHIASTHTFKAALIDSLVWRKPTAFTADLKKLRKFINQNVITNRESHENFLDALISVAPIPKHPLNANFLHKHLFKRTMPVRDAWWSTYLHRNYNGESAIDRLILWTLSDAKKSHLSKESLKLIAISMAWLLTSSNRYLRDKATKGMVTILTGNLEVVLDLLKTFEGVNDPYVEERIYAVAYGCLLRNSADKKVVKKLAQWVYKHIFEEEKPPVHILTRDYARGIIETTQRTGVVLNIEQERILPPYTSTWTNKIPEASELDKEVLKHVWGSVMYHFGSLADFGNYVLNSAVHHWSGRKLQRKRRTNVEIFENFKKALTTNQKTKFDEVYNSYRIEDLTLKVVIKNYSEIDSEEYKKEEKRIKRKHGRNIQKFKNTLNKKQNLLFTRRLEPFIDNWGKFTDSEDTFDGKVAQRWVMNRVVQMGWSQELHGEFDDTLAYHGMRREGNKPERIGKKYQWIALHELLARISDNFELKKDRWADTEENYHGPWQVGIRDIDPSCVMKDSNNKPGGKLPKIINPKPYNAWEKDIDHRTWIKTKKDLPKPYKFIELKDSKKCPWLVLDGYYRWEEETPPEERAYSQPTRDLWYMLKSYLIKKEDLGDITAWAQKQRFMGRWMPESHEFYDVFLGEYPEAPAFLDIYTPYYSRQGWVNNEGKETKIPCDVLVTTDEYSGKGSSQDCSTENGFHLKLPAKWVVDELKLTQNYVDGCFYDSKGTLLSYDSRIFDLSEPSTIVMKKDSLVNFLEKRGLTIVWTLIGEKNIIGGGHASNDFIGRLEINGFYTLDENNNLKGNYRSEFTGQ